MSKDDNINIVLTLKVSEIAFISDSLDFTFQILKDIADETIEKTDDNNIDTESTTKIEEIISEIEKIGNIQRTLHESYQQFKEVNNV